MRSGSYKQGYGAGAQIKNQEPELSYGYLKKVAPGPFLDLTVLPNGLTT